ASSGAVTASLTRSPFATGDGYLVFAQLPDVVLPGGVTFPPGDLVRVATFDVREINLDDHDSATVTFIVQTFGLPPTLLEFDPLTHQSIPVLPSHFSAVPQTPAALGNNRFRVTITFDATSQPKLTQLLGTLFTFVAPRTEPESEQSPQTPFLLASNAQAMFDLAAAPQQSFGLQRSGFSGGSDT